MVYKIDPIADLQYAEEFRKNTIGVHSPSLQRILNIMRMARTPEQYVLVARREFNDFVFGTMPPSRGDPVVIEEGPSFRTREEAEWELFRRRWRELTGEEINTPYRDDK